MQADEDGLARQVAAAVELDRSQRIVLPFQLRALPAGAAPARAYVGFIDHTYTQGGVVVRDDRGATMEVQAQYRRDSGDHGTGNYDIDDRPAFRYPGQDEVALLDHPGLHVSARIGKGYQGFELDDAETVLGGVTYAGQVDTIATWPSTPVRTPG